jgi:hypothetical protein
MPQADHKPTTRRALFAAAPAVALALPAASVAIGLPAVAAADPDTELLELGRQHAEADALYYALSDQCEAACEAAIAAYPPPPEALFHRPGKDRMWFSPDADFSRPVDAWAAGEWRQALDRDASWLQLHRRGDMVERAKEIVAAWDSWMNARDQVLVTRGVRELERRVDAQGYAVTEIEHRIFAMRATTPAGWRLKARLARRVVMDPYAPDGTYEDRLVRSLLADLTADARAT